LNLDAIAHEGTLPVSVARDDWALSDSVVATAREAHKTRIVLEKVRRIRFSRLHFSSRLSLRMEAIIRSDASIRASMAGATSTTRR
jgi:hypothetical protein